MVPEPPSWRRRGFVPKRSSPLVAEPMLYRRAESAQAAASTVRPGGGAIFSALSKQEGRAGQPAAA